LQRNVHLKKQIPIIKIIENTSTINFKESYRKFLRPPLALLSNIRNGYSYLMRIAGTPTLEWKFMIVWHNRVKINDAYFASGSGLN
jgi:hypothetical protein